MSLPATSSGELAVGTNAVIPSAARASGNSAGVLMGVTLIGGSGASTVKVYDNATSASGTVLESFAAAAGTTVVIDYGEGIAFDAGLTAVVAGTGAVALLKYRLGG